MSWTVTEHELTRPLIELLGADYLRDAKRGGWKVTIIGRWDRGAKGVLWKVSRPFMGDELSKTSGEHVLGKFANEQFAIEAADALNEAHTLYCMVRGTPAEKEFFP